ncbi:hypothetical protein V8E54_005151 [Elaphomyces granulatus]
MKSFLISSCLVSAVLAAPFIARDSSAIIQLKTGDGDTSVQVTVPLDTVFSTANDAEAKVGVNAFIVEPTSATCHAFSDNAALKPLGNDFTNTITGVFTNSNGAGDVGSDNQGVPIGAFFCSLSKAAVDAQVAKGSTSTSPPPPSSSSSATVRIENIFDHFDTAVQEDIPINTVFKTANSQLGNLSDQLSIVSATGVDVKTVTCQAFKDAEGKQPIGNPFTANKMVVLNSTGADVTINAIKCVSH